MTIPDEIKNTLGKALGKIPSGVFILTAGTPPNAQAVMASWVQQAAFQPPMVSVTLAKGRPIADLIRDTRAFVLNILPQADTTLMKKYARGIKPGEDPFANIPTRPATNGASILTDALAYLECQLVQSVDYSADHELLIAYVTNGNILKEGPSFTHLRGNGFHY